MRQTQERTTTTKKKKRGKRTQIAPIVTKSKISSRHVILLGVVLVILFFWWFMHRSGVVSGQVLDAKTNGSIMGAELVLDQVYTQQVNELTGAYIFSNVKPGKHMLEVSRPGYISQTFGFEMGAGQNRGVQFFLQAQRPESKPLEQFTVLGFDSQNSLLFLDANYQTIKKILLNGHPSAAAVKDGTLYVAERDLNRIVLIDLTSFQLTQTIQLKPFSEPSDLLLSQNKKKLLVLNPVRKTLVLIDTMTNQLLSEEISLPVTPRDAIEVDGGTTWVLGSGLLQSIYSGSTILGEALTLTGIHAQQMAYDSSSGNFILSGSEGLVLVDKYRGNIEKIYLGAQVNHVEEYHSGQFIMALEQGVVLYDLAQKRYLGPSFPYAGDYVSSAIFADDYLVVTAKPNKINVLNLKHSVIKPGINLPGKPTFIFSVGSLAK